jgi:hypothetical protein
MEADGEGELAGQETTEEILALVGEERSLVQSMMKGKGTV